MNTAITQPAPRLNLLHLLAVGIALPACLATANHLLLTSSLLSDLNAVSLSLLMGFYVLQIGLIGWAVGKVSQPWPLRWFIYGWIMVLVALQLAIMNSGGGGSYEGISCLSTAVLAGQLGMIIVWGVLGTGHIVWRVPAILVVLSQFWGFFIVLLRVRQSPPGTAYLDWECLLIIQAVLLAVLCGILRLRGYSLLKLETEPERASGDKKVPLQFGIRDVMIWTTSLAVLLAIAKASHFLTMNFLRALYAPDILLSFTIGIITAAVLIMALWSALGRGNPVIRYLMLIALSLGLGGAVGWYCDAQAKAKALAGGFSFSYWQWFSTGYWWIGWMFLTGALLAASLFIYRTLGYRLVRSAKRSKGTSAAVAIGSVSS